MFNQTASKRWFAIGLLLAAGFLLTLVAMTFDDNSVPLPALNEKPDPVDRIVPVNRIEQLSSDLTQSPVLPLVNGSHPFFTLHFKPAPPVPTPLPVVEPVPEPAPPTPPAPVFKKFVLLYQGVYKTAEGSNQAFVRLENELFVLPPGGSVLDDWAIAEISWQKLTLTNRAAETTILEFNREKTLEIQEQ